MVWANAAADASKPLTKTVPTIFSKTLPTLRFINSSSTNFLSKPTPRLSPSNQVPKRAQTQYQFCVNPKNFTMQNRISTVSNGPLTQGAHWMEPCVYAAFLGGKLWQLFAYLRSE